MEDKLISVPINPDEEQLVVLQQDIKKHYNQIRDKFYELGKFCENLFKETKSLMGSFIDTDPIVLQEMLVKCSSLSFTLGQALADAKYYLQLYEIMFFTPKKQNYSEADRKLYIQTKTVIQLHLVRSLENAEEKINQRITILQSLLKSETKRI